MSARVGQDIESICGKCGDVWHVVVAMKGSTIAKVQCKQCGGYHRHKPPGGKAGVSAPRAPRASTTRSTRKKKPTEPQVPADPSRPPRPYRITESFEVGDTVVHPSFGTGVVERVLEDKKVQVFFPDGQRVLAHQR